MSSKFQCKPSCLDSNRAVKRAQKDAKAAEKAAKLAEKRERTKTECPLPYPDFWRTALSSNQILKCYQFKNKPAGKLLEYFTEEQHTTYWYYKKVSLLVFNLLWHKWSNSDHPMVFDFVAVVSIKSLKRSLFL